MDINRVIIIGRLVRDPESRLLPSGTAVTSFRVAVNRRPSREGVSNADFFDVVAWRQLGELCAKYLKKGQRVAIEGSLRQRSWQDQNGNYQNKIEIVAENIQFLESKGGQQTANAVEASQDYNALSGEELAAESSTGYDEVFDVLETNLEDEIDELDEFNFQGGDSD
ncbi:MAG: single-stranded DNA-binding protein [Actinobacteria bacterium]|nr:single-stranded DNA-binding protein [Actinomycetota bacterium]